MLRTDMAEVPNIFVLVRIQAMTFKSPRQSSEFDPKSSHSGCQRFPRLNPFPNGFGSLFQRQERKL